MITLILISMLVGMIGYLTADIIINVIKQAHYNSIRKDIGLNTKPIKVFK